MKTFVVGKANEFKEGQQIAVQAGKRVISVFRMEGEFYAVNNTCPHKGASLCEGIIDKERKVVRCPWHLWNWSLETGCLEANVKDRIPTYKTEVVDGEILLYVN